MQMQFDFSAQAEHHITAPSADSVDDRHLPASEKQLRYAQQIATRLRRTVPKTARTDRKALSEWIDAHKSAVQTPTQFSNYPSSKQVAFAERLARIKRRTVPDACFRDRISMSRWIESNR